MLMHSLNDSNEKYVLNGEPIMHICELFEREGVANTAINDAMVDVVCGEFEFASSILSTVPCDRNLNVLLKARVEYMLRAFSAIFEVCTTH